MIIKDILSKKWEKFQTACLYFFTLLSILSLLLTIFFLKYPKHQIFTATPSQISSLKKNRQNTLQPCEDSFWTNNDSHPYVLSPPIEKRLFFVGANTRPDCKEKSVALSSDQNKIIAKINETIYLNCKNPKNLFFTDQATPFTITPLSFHKEKLKVKFSTTYKNIEGKIVHNQACIKTLCIKNNNQTKVSTNSANACKSLSKTQFLGPDKLLSIFGGKKFFPLKNCYRLLFKNNSTTLCSFIKKGDLLHFVDNQWIKCKKELPKTPLFQVTSITPRKIIGIFWNENGFFEKEYTIPITRRGTTNVHTFSFDKIYKRSNDSVICKIKDRTILLKPHDWLVKKNSTWSTIKTVTELDNIVNLNTFHELIIFDKIINDKEQEIFIGYIFDKTRSNYKKLQIPLKKKEKLRYTK